MTSSIFLSVFNNPKSPWCLYTIFIGASLISFLYFTGTSKWSMPMFATAHKSRPDFCKSQCRPFGSESLPDGIVVQTSNLEMMPLWDSSTQKEKFNPRMNLLAIAVGVQQKMIVNRMVEKFLSSGFIVMLFHYDGIVDEWSDLKWYDHVVHVSAKNQTKWWFAKRFLQPDIIAEYDYVFLWDEDLDVENFHPQRNLDIEVYNTCTNWHLTVTFHQFNTRYINVVSSEGLEISQPALDPTKSVVHHPLTARQKNTGVHRRFYKLKGSGRCDDNSKSPPCIGWVEMMAPVFSKAAWRCVWYMIQNDLIHAWGLDRQLGYCAQGDRTKNVGIVDSEYIVHLGLPTLGVLERKKELSEPLKIDNRSAEVILLVDFREGYLGNSTAIYVIYERHGVVRRQSFMEMQMFNQRWKDAVKNDKCWVDLYGQPDQQTTL